MEDVIAVARRCMTSRRWRSAVGATVVTRRGHRGEQGVHGEVSKDGGEARWPTMATVVGGATAMASLGFGATRGRKGSRGVRIGERRGGATSVAPFI